MNTYVDRYAEQVVNDANSDISKYLTFLKERGLTLGGVSTEVVLLKISSRYVKPNNTAISAIGEALAGWYLQTKKNLIPLARPIQEGADLIFMDEKRDSYFLVSVKATMGQFINTFLKDATVALLKYANNNIKYIPPTTLLSNYIIGVAIKKNENYEIKSIKIDLG
nr:hypothetical protein [Candidatus Freyarchaeota archaeon]